MLRLETPSCLRGTHLAKKGWKVACLDSRQGFEYKGVVDLVAVKRNNRSPDELTMMLVQVKGGSASVTRVRRALQVCELQEGGAKARQEHAVLRDPWIKERPERKLDLSPFVLLGWSICRPVLRNTATAAL